jgi:hypothetical protein
MNPKSKPGAIIVAAHFVTLCLGIICGAFINAHPARPCADLGEHFKIELQHQHDSDMEAFKIAQGIAEAWQARAEQCEAGQTKTLSYIGQATCLDPHGKPACFVGWCTWKDGRYWPARADGGCYAVDGGVQ